MSFVAISVEELDRMFCKVDLGQLKLGCVIVNLAVLLESLLLFLATIWSPTQMHRKTC